MAVSTATRPCVQPSVQGADGPFVALLESDWWTRRQARRRAGSRAREKYKQMRRSWLRRKRKLWVLVSLGLAAIWLLLTVLVFAMTPPTGQWAATWASGFIAGAAFAVVIALRESPPGSIEMWQEGAYGEAGTAKVLERLPASWDVLHDLRNGDYNFDHVVIGPPGVFLLNSKWSTYRLQTVDGGLRGVHPDDESLTLRLDRIIGQAKRDAVDLKKAIEARTGRALWVNPVVVWWGPFADGGKTVGGVAFVQGDQLVKRITALPERHATDLKEVVEVLRPGRHRHSSARG